jgi:hypothetical protein
MRLMISQVIGRPPAEVFRFVATEHFQNHPKVGSVDRDGGGHPGSGSPKSAC